MPHSEGVDVCLPAMCPVRCDWEAGKFGALGRALPNWPLDIHIYSIRSLPKLVPNGSFPT